jgi:phospholipid N-methyltransferase
MGSSSIYLEQVFTSLPSKLEERFPYFVHAAKDPNVATLVPSSQHLCQALCKKIDFRRVRTVFELGAGEGVITRCLLQKLSADARLYAFETNGALLDLLQRRTLDYRIIPLQEDAFNLGKIAQAKNIHPDLIISGIPFSFFTDEKIKNFIIDALAAIHPQGTFILYQTWLPPFWTLSRCRKLIRSGFVEKSVENVYRNFPPLRIIEAKPRINY